MPNYVKNFVTINAHPELLKEIKEDLFTFDKSELIRQEEKLKNMKQDDVDYNITKEIIDILKSKDDSYFQRNFDFNKIIPMPDNIFRGDVGNEEREKYGKNNWYDWSVENWDTKWNSMESTVSLNDNELKYTFFTAWSCPVNVFITLAKIYNITVKVIYYDEDLGFNCGSFNCDNKGFHEDIICNNQDEGFNFLANVLGESFMNQHGLYKNDEGKYCYKD